MKKSTLLVWAVLFSAPLFAQGENKNLIKNGDFEDTGYVSFVYEDNVKCCPDLVTGWDADKQRGEDGFKDKDFNNKGLSKFYVRGEIVTTVWRIRAGNSVCVCSVMNGPVRNRDIRKG